jgi:iron complex outermembrane recepter protein
MLSTLIKGYLFISLLLFVQTAKSEEIQVLYVEGASDVLSANQLKISKENFKTGAIEAADVLIGLPGLQIDSRSNFAQDTRISLRGFGARSAFGIRGIDLLVDTVPISTPDGQGQLSSIQINRIQQVDVITGPVSALYGNSPGGVVAFTTQVPEKIGVDLQFSQSDQDQENALLNLNWKQGDLAVASQFNQYQSNTDRPHSFAEREQQSIAVYYTSENKWEWILKYDRSHDPLLQDPLGLTPQQFAEDPFQENLAAINFNTRKRVESQQISMSLRKAQGDSRWQLGVWNSDRDIGQYLGFSGDALTSAGGVVDLHRQVKGINANFTQDFSWLNRNWQWSVGTELTSMQDDRQGFVNNAGVEGDLRRDEKGEVINSDIYSLIRFKPNENINTFAGLRYSYMDFFVDDYFVRSNNNGVLVNPDDSGEKQFTENAIAIGMDYAFAEDWKLFASIGKGYETPTLTEMAYQTNNTGLNIELDSSENRQMEWGFNYKADEWLWQISQFTVLTEKEIIVDQSINGRTSFRNAQKTQRRGVELLNQYQFNDWWRASLSAQYSQAEFTQGQWNHNQLPGSAKKVYQADLSYFPFASEKLSIHVNSVYRSEVATADDNLVFAPSWWLWNLSLQSTIFSNLECWLKVNNLTDKIYVGSVIVNQTNGRAFEPGLGRYTSLGVRLMY